MSPKILAHLVLVALIATVITCCAASAARPHFELGEEVSKLMRRMETLVYEHQLDAHEIEELREDRTDALIHAVNAMINAMPEALAERGATADESRRIEQRSQQLSNEVSEFQRLVRLERFEEAAVSYQRVQNTCLDCHEQLQVGGDM